MMDVYEPLPSVPSTEQLIGLTTTELDSFVVPGNVEQVVRMRYSRAAVTGPVV